MLAAGAIATAIMRFGRVLAPGEAFYRFLKSAAFRVAVGNRSDDERREKQAQPRWGTAAGENLDCSCRLRSDGEECWPLLEGAFIRILFLFATAALVTGCASSSSEITAAYVSPLMYQNHNCQQLGMEAQGISARAAQIAGVQDSKRTNDAIATTVAVIVFWPAAFAVKGDGATAAELAQLKGQMNAIEQASIMKKCNIKFEKPVPTS